MSKPDESVRFAFGAPDRPLSSVWKLWIKRNEVYLGSRSTAGHLKYSFHSSGDWRLAATKQSGYLFEGDRNALRWHRPPEFKPGWTQALSIVVPFREAEAPPQPGGPPNVDVIWIPGPDPGHKVAMMMLYGAGGRDARREFDDRHLIYGDGHGLPNGERVWLLSRTDPLSSADAKAVGVIERKAAAFRAAPGAPRGIRYMMMTSVGGDLFPQVMEFALGAE